MTDSTSERPEATPTPTQTTPIPAQPGTPLPPQPPTAPPYGYPAPTAGGGTRKGGLIAIGVVIGLLLAGGGFGAWWAVNDGDDGGNPTGHVEVSDGKLVTDDNLYGEECDDTDAFSYNDCDSTSTDATYQFDYEITNKGDGFANYSVVVNAFDEDGDYIGQTYIGATHLAAGKTEAEEGTFNEYDSFEDGHDVSDIESVEVAYVERRSLAN
ncbi:MAG: hypothetical protein H5T76_11270 [Streptomyces sp.]|nr:hypothetical protein [Streptomyces sp.]